MLMHDDPCLTDVATLPPRGKAAPEQLPGGTRGRVDLHPARSGRRVPQCRAPVFRRQGFRGRPAPRAEGLLPREGAGDADAHRHRAQLSRGHRLPRPDGARHRPAARRALAGRFDPHGPRAIASPERVAQPAPGGHAARRHRRTRVRRVHRRCPPRRGKGARQGARVLVPRRLRPMEPQGAAARAVVAVQRARPQGRKHARVPAVELDRTRRLAVHPAGSAFRCRNSISRIGATSSGAGMRWCR